MSPYSGIFKARYQLQGRDWLNRIDPDDVKAFVEIGHSAAQWGRLGGEATKQKYPDLTAEGKNKHLSEIGRRGAIVTNIKRWMKAAIKQETEQVFGIELPY